MKKVTGLALAAGMVAALSAQAPAASVATIGDAVRMTRIQHSVDARDAAVAISPDGRKAVAVTWRGDIPRNVNVYSLLVFELDRPGPQQPAAVLNWDFAGDPEDQSASPFSSVTFLPDNRTLAFIGRKDAGVAQVYTVDTMTRELHQLTRHPAAVRSFVVGADGKLVAFSAVVSSLEGNTGNRLIEDGVFPWDNDVFPVQFTYDASLPLLIWKDGDRPLRQYFLSKAGKTSLFFDSHQSRPAPLDYNDPNVRNSPKTSLMDDYDLRGMGSIVGDPKGRYVLMYPYALGDHSVHPERYTYFKQPRFAHSAYIPRVAAPYGLVDVKTGKIQRLIDAPTSPFEYDSFGSPLWTPDGNAVIVFTLLPEHPEQDPQWVQIDVATRNIRPLGLPADARPLGWLKDGKGLIVGAKGGHFGTILRSADGGWGKFTETATAQGFNRDWKIASNGSLIVGVKDALLTPPELVALDPVSGQDKVLSDFNPALRQLQYGETAPYRWKNAHNDDANGFLIKPVGYESGKRYPLVVLLDDGTLWKEGEPYLLDAAWQLSGHAIQMLAAQGFMVLYTREPPLHAVIETPEEGARMQEHIDSAIAALDKDGLIDPKHVGLSGWSRAGYYTDYMLIHDSSRFAAASIIDGGGVEYNDGMRPFTDEELKRIHTPKLFEMHGLASFVSLGDMSSRMLALGKPVDVLYFHTASHSTTRPQHRLRSLQTHIDWWRFWLKGEEDGDPDKAAQYQHWHELRDKQSATVSQ